MREEEAKRERWILARAKRTKRRARGDEISMEKPSSSWKQVEDVRFVDGIVTTVLMLLLI